MIRCGVCLAQEPDNGYARSEISTSEDYTPPCVHLSIENHVVARAHLIFARSNPPA